LKQVFGFIVFLVVICAIVSGCSEKNESIIRIGVIAELTGQIPAWSTNPKTTIDARTDTPKKYEPEPA